VAMNIFALLKESNPVIKRIAISRELQNGLFDYFKPDLEEMKRKARVRFDGQYKPEEGEVLLINDFVIPFADELNINAEVIQEQDIEKIKAIIIKVSNEEVGFQTFDSRKIISPNKWHLTYSQGTFSKLERKAISISKNIDVLYTNKFLLFSSFQNASKIFDLSDVYRELTDQEIDELKSSDIIEFSDGLDKSLFDSRMRKKLYQIKRSHVLDNVKQRFDRVKACAEQFGLEQYFDDGKVMFPSSKRELKVIIDFLSDDIFRSSITEDVYETNSKKKIDQRRRLPSGSRHKKINERR